MVVINPLPQQKIDSATNSLAICLAQRPPRVQEMINFLLLKPLEALSEKLTIGTLLSRSGNDDRASVGCVE